MQWFVNVNTIDDLRQKYKELLIKYHPDNNPNTDTTSIMQSINSEYDSLVKTLKGVHSDTTSTDFSEDELKQVLNELVKIKADIVIELIGRWIWVYGPDTKAIKERLKELGFRWSSKKEKWHWGTSAHKNTKPMEMSFIRAKYGSTVYQNFKEEQKAIN